MINNFKDIVDIVFIKKQNWINVSNKDKETYFFIFNRYMSKKFPIKAHFFNKPNIDKATAMDIWFMSLQNERRVPYWFWKGNTKKKQPQTKDWKLVYDYYEGELSINDILLLEEFDINELKKEIKEIKKFEKLK